MKKYFKALGILTILFLLSACITLTEEEKKMIIATNPDIVKNCRFIDRFKIITAIPVPMSTQGSTTYGYVFFPMNKLSNKQKYKIKRTTLKKGGDTAFFESNKKPKLSKKIKVYQCSKQSPQAN